MKQYLILILVYIPTAFGLTISQYTELIRAYKLDPTSEKRKELIAHYRDFTTDIDRKLADNILKVLLDISHIKSLEKAQPKESLPNVIRKKVTPTTKTKKEIQQAIKYKKPQIEQNTQLRILSRKLKEYQNAVTQLQKVAASKKRQDKLIVEIENYLSKLITQPESAYKEQLITDTKNLLNDITKASEITESKKLEEEKEKNLINNIGVP